MKLDIPLMNNNITREDLDALIDFLKTDAILTQHKNVREFEKEWSEWLGVKHSVFVNSGSSANLITIAAIKHLYGGGEIIVPTLTWVSDIASVMQNDFTPVFVDIDPDSLAMDPKQIMEKVTDKTRAVFLTHILGLNGLTKELLDFLEQKNILLIEDVCESHGATFKGKRLGSYGHASNFSFYYAHHMSTIEGGMVCTNNDDFYQALRMLRSHGMVREATDENLKQKYYDNHPDLNPSFIFAFPAYNVRSTELNAVMGRHQLKRLDSNNEIRYDNFKMFLDNLDSSKYKTDFDIEGSVNYAFILVIKEKDPKFRQKVTTALSEAGVEFRGGTSGGGNQIRQPYLKHLGLNPEDYPVTDHIHSYGFYIGNFPDLEKEKISGLCELLNSIN
jgi:CDP-4-dehydro-6-deoxyglucose reductase, E1